ncbi:MAG: PQQ-like beta-propeller repeat protein [Rhodospirillales bacterium]|nr:PQQ-like beta-propeller repeat protein [Rhodospirillales bacterium]
MTRRLPLLLLALAVWPLAACDSLYDMGDVWLGENKKPLAGKRVSVMVHERVLNPDPSITARDIRIPAPEDNDAWPQAGGYPSHAMHHMVLNDGLKRAWRSDIGAGSSDTRRLMAQPVVADGLVFVMDAEARVSAFEEKSGKRLWRVNLTPKDEDDDHMGGGVAYDNGRLFVTTGFARVYALEAASGKTLWTQTLAAPMRAAPTVFAGRVLVVTVENQTLALDANDGRTLWTHQGIAEAASVLGGANPAVSAGTVVTPYSSGELVAIRIENGAVLWSDSLAAGRRTDAVSALSDIRGRPIVDRGRVFAISNSNQTVAIDLRTGRRLWEAEIGGLQSPWVAGDYLYLITNDIEMVCLEAKTGRVHWVTPLQRWENMEKKKGTVLWAGPVLASDRLVAVGTHGWAVAISPYNGEVLGFEKMPDGLSIAPAIANGGLYFVTEAGELVAYR